MEGDTQRILVVDDEENVLFTVSAILRHEGYDVETAPDGTAALEALQQRSYDLVLTDLKMPGIDGLQVLAEAQKRSPDTATVMMTGYASVDSALESVRLGAYEYLLKPTEVEDLKMAVRRALERKWLSQTETLLRVGQSLGASLDVESSVTEVSSAVRNALGVTHADFFLLQDQGRPLPDPLRHPELLDLWRRGETITDASAPLPLLQWAEQNRICSFAFVPGIVRGELVCVLRADNANQPFDFHASALRFLRAMASHAALPLANASLVAKLQRKNRELEEANQKLRELDRLKSQFLSVATHELRTPLSVILGYTSMLAESLEGRLSEEEGETLRQATAACRRLIRLVNSMLDITQIESGRLRMNITPGDLRKVVNDVASLFQHDARQRGLHLAVELPVRLPRVSMDVERIEQVLVNLVGNAMKFTPAGGTVVMAVRHKASAESVEVSVSDTGVGITPADQGRLFREFETSSSAASDQNRGTGLGLAIARRIVEALGGDIGLESVPGKGSSFHFTLPVSAARNFPKAVSA